MVQNAPFIIMAQVIPGQEIARRSEVSTWLEHYHVPVDRSRHYKSGEALFWRLPDFLIHPKDVDTLLDKARPYRAVILDLRGNPGGLNETMKRFTGGFLDHDTEIGKLKGRIEANPQIAKTRHNSIIRGKLIVLLDSKSMSAAEIFAGVIQIEKRGIVLGDRSAGGVMESRYFVHAVHLNAAFVAQYGLTISVEGLIMGDGKNLEGAGIVPDELIQSTPADLAAGRDPVLARAGELAEISMSPEEAGKVFPFEFPRAKMPDIGDWPAVDEDQEDERWARSAQTRAGIECFSENGWWRWLLCEWRSTSYGTALCWSSRVR